MDSSMTLHLTSTKILPADFQNQNISANVNQIVRDVTNTFKAGLNKVWSCLEQPGLMDGVPAHGRGLELGDL